MRLVCFSVLAIPGALSMDKAMKRFVSWNVNGLRACLRKGFEGSLEPFGADFICLQEVKCQEDTCPPIALDCPYSFFNYAEKRGYSGTAILARHEPQEVSYDIPGHKGEGRLICLRYPTYALVNAYVPNSGDALKRLDYRTGSWEPDLRAYLEALAQQTPVIYCGDLNVAHEDIDLTNPERNHRSAGFTDEEREAFRDLLASGFRDSFRELYPDLEGAYTWWSYRMSARERNIGWRIDYFLITPDLLPALRGATIHPDIFGSDHCPVGIVLDL